MKKNNKLKIITLLSIIVIIAGIIVTTVLGFNFELAYQDTKKVELYINKEFEVSDIKQITNEVFKDEQVVIQKVEVFEDTASVMAKDITDEQKTELITKVNEKYGTEIKADSTEIVLVPHIKGRDIIKPYIQPLTISTIIILAYMAIRYYKLNILKVLVKTVGVLAIVEGVVFSLIAITRLPISRFTMPVALTIYLLTLIAITTNFEKQLKVKKEKENNKE